MRKNYSKELKAKIVMEILREEETLAQIASKYYSGYQSQDQKTPMIKVDLLS